MKKTIAACLCAVMMLLAGCGATATPAPSGSTPTTEPTSPPATAPVTEPTLPPETIPETDDGEVVALEAPAVLAVLERGEPLLIEGEWEDYYIVSTAYGRGYVEKRLVAYDGEEETEPKTMFAKRNAELFTGYLLRGEPERTLSTNTELQLLADLGDCCLVELDGVLGYVPTDMLSENRIRSSGSSGGSEGGGGGGGGGGGAPSAGADGGDISLTAFGGAPIVCVNLSASSVAAAHVISIEAELYAVVYQRGDHVRVFSEEDGICTLYIDGVFATVERRCLMLEGDEAFESRAGYTAYGANIFRSIDLRGEVLDSPKTNTELTLLWEFENRYLASAPDGTLGYISADMVRNRPIVHRNPGSDGGGGGGGSSGGGGEWSDPVL